MSLSLSLSLSLFPRTTSIFKIGLVFTTLFLILSFFHLQRDYKQIYHIATLGEKGAFIQSFLESEIDGPFDNSSIVALCSQQKWTPGLIFNCEPPRGGIANVRNQILSCIRFGIEAGATGLIMPTLLAKRLPTSPTPSSFPLTHFFALDHFTRTLSSSCPQIKLYNEINDLWDKPSIAKPLSLKPSTLLSNISTASPLLFNPSDWRNAFFTEWLNLTHPTPFSEALPILVNIAPTLLTWPILHDPPHFITNFGKILIFRDDIRHLAATVLFALSEKYDLNLNPGTGIQEHKFYGAHLRTGHDAELAHWTPFTIQAENYLAGANASGCAVVYTATDDVQHLYQFADRAKGNRMVVETKEVLLGGTYVYVQAESNPNLNRNTNANAKGKEQSERDVEKEGKMEGAPGFEKEYQELKGLGWDQKVAVDWEVLLWGSGFGGTWESTTSWGVGLRRGAVGGDAWVGGTGGFEGGRSGGGVVGRKMEGLGLEGRDGDDWEGRNGKRGNSDLDIPGGKRDSGITADDDWEQRTGEQNKRTDDWNTPAGRRDRGERTDKRQAAHTKGKVPIYTPTAGAECWSDDLSTIFGKPGGEEVFLRGMWP